MADPIRERILAAAAARLALVSVANGYRQDVVRVSRRPVLTDAVNELPIFVLLPAVEEDSLDYTEMAPDGVITGTLGFEVMAVAVGDDLEVLATRLERLLADAEVALCSTGPPDPRLDLHLGLGEDLVKDVRNTGRGDAEGLPTESADGRDRGFMSRVFRVQYDYTRANP